MRRVFLRVRLLDNHLWENTGCCTLVVWTVSVCRGRFGLTLTIMCAAVLLSLASLLFACYAVVSANMRQRDPVLKGTLLSRLYSGEDGSVPLPDDRDNLVQVRAMIQDGHTGRSILIKTPTDIHDQRRVADDGSRKAANIFILLNSNVSRLLNTTKSPTQRSAENKDHGTPSGTTFQESNRHVDERTTHENASSLRYAVVDAGSGATRNLPQAIIIGVKKGGTRALLEFIRLHPDVRAPGPETHFFDRNYHKGLDWYRRKMPPTIAGQITIEKTPSYFVTREVPRRVYDMSKDVKLIVVVRDPVTRAISDYTQAKAKRPKTKSFEQLAFLDNNTGVVDTSWGAIRIGVYAKHLERWLKYFPLEQIHFVNGEKLITDPAREIAKVQAFLGLKCIVTEKHFYFNENKGFPCLKKHEGSGKPHCLGKTKGRTHPNIQPRAVQRLRDFFHPFNVKFFSMVGTDFGWPVK